MDASWALIAQLIVMDINRVELGGPPDFLAKEVELDGDPSTLEWAGWHHEGAWANQYRVLAWRDGRLCVGPRFSPFPVTGGWWWADFSRTFPTSIEVIQLDGNRQMKVALLIPSRCETPEEYTPR